MNLSKDTIRISTQSGSKSHEWTVIDVDMTTALDRASGEMVVEAKYWSPKLDRLVTIIEQTRPKDEDVARAVKVIEECECVLADEGAAATLAPIRKDVENWCISMPDGDLSEGIMLFVERAFREGMRLGR